MLAYVFSQGTIIYILLSTDSSIQNGLVLITYTGQFSTDESIRDDLEFVTLSTGI